MTAQVTPVEAWAGTVRRYGGPDPEPDGPVVYARAERWSRCGTCGSVIWVLGPSAVEASDAAAAHEAFCRPLK